MSWSVILSWLLVLPVLPGTIYLLVLTAAASVAQRRKKTSPTFSAPLAIIVPAHNEQTGIEATLHNLLTIAKADGATDVIVIADNCTDDTAELARRCGANVLERTDATQRGKGFALQYAFDTLSSRAYEAFIVIDADSQADDNFLASIRRHLASGAYAVQAKYTVLDADQTPRTKLADVALTAFNVVRPTGRDRLGLSVGIFGNGFVLHRHALAAVPYTAGSVVEDLEYHIALVQANVTVRFAADTRVRAAMPTGSAGSNSQRARWEGGRLRMIKLWVPTLLAQVSRARWRLLEPLLELLTPPLALFVTALLGLLVAGVLTGVANILAVSVIGLLTVGWHVGLTIKLCQFGRRDYRVLLQVPGYLLWKLRILPAIIAGSRRDSEWIRTNRKGD